MTPAARIRLARVRLRWCRVRSAYARARIQAVTLYGTLCSDLRQTSGHRHLLILGLLWLVASVWNWMLALYVLPTIIGAVRQASRRPLGTLLESVPWLDGFGVALRAAMGITGQRCNILAGPCEDLRSLVRLTA